MPRKKNAFRFPKLCQSMILLAVVCLYASTGCTRKFAPVASAAMPSDNASMDLLAGTKLRIIVPVFTSGGYKSTAQSMQSEGNTIVLSATDLVGFNVLHYAVQGVRNGKVRLRFTAADLTRDGKTRQQFIAPQLPFSLAFKPQHIRLIYLTRSSPADHNMAIAASMNLASLDQLTTRLKADPDACTHSGAVYCTWVPAGIAVRPE